jgi:3-hydroxyisobutyrate dehydrogenase
MSHVAWLGTGLLGSGFVEGLLARGEKVTVWNRTLEKARPLESLGARIAKTPAEAVDGAGAVHLCLSDDAAVDAVLEALRPKLGRDVPVIDHTTVSPDGARGRQARLAKESVPFLACPVFMGPGAARTASGMMLCAGSAELVGRMRGHLAKMTGELIVMGDDAARPATIKLLGNALLISIAGSIADVLAIAKQNDVAPDEAMALLGKFPLGNIIAGRGTRMAAGDYAASFELSMARKDVGLMMRAAGDAPLATLPGLHARMSALIDAGHGQDDLGVLAIGSVPKKA